MVVVPSASLLRKPGILFLSLSVTALPTLPSNLALKQTSSNGILTSNRFSAAQILNFLFSSQSQLFCLWKLTFSKTSIGLAYLFFFFFPSVSLAMCLCVHASVCVCFLCWHCVCLHECSACVFTMLCVNMFINFVYVPLICMWVFVCLHVFPDEVVKRFESLKALCKFPVVIIIVVAVTWFWLAPLQHGAGVGGRVVAVDPTLLLWCGHWGLHGTEWRRGAMSLHYSRYTFLSVWANVK